MARKSKAPAKRGILCPRCDTSFEVSVKAQSIMCPGCNKIAKCADEKIKAYCARQELFTEGKVEVTKKGHVIAEVRVLKLVVAGEVKGQVRARESVSIKKTGKIYGDVTTPTLSVELGAHLVGYCAIGIPVEVPDEEEAPASKSKSKSKAKAS